MQSLTNIGTVRMSLILVIVYIMSLTIEIDLFSSLSQHSKLSIVKHTHFYLQFEIICNKMCSFQCETSSYFFYLWCLLFLILVAHRWWWWCVYYNVRFAGNLVWTAVLRPSSFPGGLSHCYKFATHTKVKFRTMIADCYTVCMVI